MLAHTRLVLTSCCSPLFKSFDLPFPIITAKAYTTSIKETAPLAVGLAPLSAVTYETTPFECARFLCIADEVVNSPFVRRFGSFDPELSAFYPTRFLGTPLSAGSPTSPVCVSGYDKASFVFGASSALFVRPSSSYVLVRILTLLMVQNAFNVTNNPDWVNPNASLGQSWRLVNSTFYPFQPNQQIDIAPLPNPFLDVSADTYEDSKQTQLRLADGAIDGLGDPLSPLIVRARAVDVVVVIGAVCRYPPSISTCAERSCFRRAPTRPNSSRPVSRSCSLSFDRPLSVKERRSSLRFRSPSTLSSRKDSTSDLLSSDAKPRHRSSLDNARLPLTRSLLYFFPVFRRR